MLARPFRLTRTQDFARLFEAGTFFGGAKLQLKIWSIDPSRFPRRGYTKQDLKIGIIVSTKVDKRAVGRNRLKRQLREIMRLLVKDQKIRPGYLMTIMANKSAAGATYSDLQTEVHGLLQRARVLV